MVTTATTTRAGSKLRQLRRRHDITQEALARRLGKSGAPVISTWERYGMTTEQFCAAVAAIEAIVAERGAA